MTIASSKKRAEKTRKILFYLGNLIIGLIFISPLIWMISSSFKQELSIFSNMTSLSTFLPLDFTVDNYIEVFQRLNIPQILKNTFLYIGIVLLGELLEAASIDGCGTIRTFFQVVMPISKTVYATVFILDFVARWNDFMWPFLITTGEDKRTVQLAVQVFFGTKPVHYGAIMAALTLASIPMLILYIFMQKYYVQGIASTGIKG